MRDRCLHPRRVAPRIQRKLRSGSTEFFPINEYPNNRITTMPALLPRDFRVGLEHRSAPASFPKTSFCWSRHSGAVAVSGDGVDGAPALRKARMGIAVSKSTASGDAVLLDLIWAHRGFYDPFSAGHIGQAVPDHRDSYLTITPRSIGRLRSNLVPDPSHQRCISSMLTPSGAAT